jgi:hypothetical protein
MKSATNRNGREELREWLGLDYRDFDLRPNNRDAVSRKDILKLACLFARGDRSGAKVVEDEAVTLTESDLYLEALASAALKTLFARAQSGNEDAQRLFFDLACEAVGDFEQLGFRDLPTFKQRARKRAEIPAMISRIKGSHEKTERLLDLLEQGEDCPRPGLDGQAKAFTAMPWLVTALHDNMEGFRRSAARFEGACTPLDETVQSFISLPDFSSKSVELWIAASWSWLLRSTCYERLGDHTQIEAEERHIRESDLFKSQPLNDKPARLRKAFNAAWREMAAEKGKLPPKNGDSSAGQ